MANMIRVFRCTSNSQFMQDVSLQEGVYTFSCYVKTGRYSYLFRVIYNDNAAQPLTYYPYTNDWERVEVTFTATKGVKRFDLCSSASYSAPVWIAAPMLEAGNNASTARPNDLDHDERADDLDERVIDLGYQVTYNKNQFEQNYWKKTDGKSYVDGKIASVTNDYNTKITQAADAITLQANRVTTLEGRVTETEAAITVNAENIALRVTEEQMNAAIELSADEIRSEVSDVEAGLQSTITQKVGEVNASIAALDGRTYQIELDVNSLTSRVTSAEGDINTLEQTATSLTSRISSAETNISTIQQTADSISLSVQNLESDLLATGINITDKEIELIANKTTFKDNQGNVIALFNADGKKVQAGAIELETLQTKDGKFKVLADGSIEAVDGKFTGDVTASSGTIGGFTIGAGSLEGTGEEDTMTLTPRLIKFYNVKEKPAYPSSYTDTVEALISDNPYPDTAGGGLTGPMKIRVDRSSSQSYKGLAGILIDVKGQNVDDGNVYYRSNALLIENGNIAGARFALRRVQGTFQATKLDFSILVYGNYATVKLPDNGLVPEDGQELWVNPNRHTGVKVTANYPIYTSGGSLYTHNISGGAWHLYRFNRRYGDYGWIASWMNA